MPKELKKLALLAILPILITTGCLEKKVGPRATLENLYEQYENGSIPECQYDGATVYIAGINGYDAGTVIYGQNGNRIGTCNYAWGR